MVATVFGMTWARAAISGTTPLALYQSIGNNGPKTSTGTRAIALPDNSYNKASPFLKVFGRPDNASVCECERVQSSSLAQSRHLLNSRDIKTKLTGSKGRAAALAAVVVLPALFALSARARGAHGAAQG